MGKRTLCSLLIAGSLVAFSGCQGGPHKLRKSWEDWTNQKYTESSWVHGALLSDIIPVYPIVGFVLGFGDLFVNAYYFWSKDAWDGKGTGFDHKALVGAEKSVSSFIDKADDMMDDGM
jgi:hypothetical protein